MGNGETHEMPDGSCALTRHAKFYSYLSNGIDRGAKPASAIHDTAVQMP